MGQALLSREAALAQERDATSERRTCVVVLTGIATGGSLALLVVCPSIHLPLCAPCATCVMSAAALLVMRQGDWFRALRGEALLAAGLTGAAFVSLEQTGELSASAPLPLFMVLLACLVGAWLLEREEVSQLMASVADLVLVGDDRVRSYLAGRGASTLQTEVVLLTAHGFDLSHVAADLRLSTAMLSNYRTLFRCG